MIYKRFSLRVFIIIKNLTKKMLRATILGAIVAMITFETGAVNLEAELENVKW